ncbi:MAG: insulinase family protein, partial [Candidatus Zixiibacteriota bacterium]
MHVIILTSLLGMTAAAETRQLDNGMQVILKENHGSPMIASMVFVRSGSKYESRFENGITHFLEHLLFDGTANLSREEIDRSIRDLGGYINAFTRKELTSFIVLLPKQYITYGMTVQADMLFNSTFPENELPKERKVVIEEINRDADSPGSVAEAFFTEKAYAGTAYARPVLGYAPFIENIPRAAIVDYWRKYYRPENMTLLLIGDFDSDSMFTAAQQVFGKVALPGPAASPPKPQSPDYGAIVGKNVYDTVATVKSTYVKLSLPAPRWNDPDYLPFDLLVQYLNLDEISPLKQALLSGDKPMATEVDISLSTYAEFSRLDISVLTNDPARRG